MKPPERFPPDDPREWLNRARSGFAMARNRVPDAYARVRQRIREGGHNVPEPIIRRRYHAGWRNFEAIYRDLVDEWTVYDNSGNIPVLLAEESKL